MSLLAASVVIAVLRVPLLPLLVLVLVLPQALLLLLFLMLAMALLLLLALTLLLLLVLVVLLLLLLLPQHLPAIQPPSRRHRQVPLPALRPLPHIRPPQRLKACGVRLHEIGRAHV